MNFANHTKTTGHAIVIGGSIAGLLTARVLTNHFAQVTVIERDLLPQTPDFRKGAPHARHAHGLLVRGQQIMESYFPGLADDLLAQGAIAANMGAELSLYIGGVPVKSFTSDLVITACSRPLLECTIGRRLRALPQVRFLEGCDVTGICTDPNRQRVAGVRVQSRQEKGTEEIIHADLIVDASGRNSRLPDWLAELGYPVPDESTVDAQAGYATRIYRRPANYPGRWQALYGIPQAPGQSRGCIIAPLEGDRWHVTLTGLNGDHPPTDEEGFLAFARSVPVPELYRALSNAEPLTEPCGYRRGANRLRHYDKLPRYLEGLLAIGDAVYALNPVYGQGMTVAALAAVTLDETLGSQHRHPANDPTGLARRFQRRLAKVIAAPWQMATGQDLRWPSVGAGYKPDPITRLVQGYFDRVLSAMTNNPEIAAAFAKVQNMLASPATLFYPHIVWQVLRSRPQGTLPDGRGSDRVAAPDRVRQARETF
jgi:2-polyprenyl-6-methoxyphenol hydroxylase-like FAD-dependent oxidoreductase